MKKPFNYILIALLALVLLAGCGAAPSESDGDAAGSGIENETGAENESEAEASSSGDDINLRDIYGGGYQYLFTYKFTRIHLFQTYVTLIRLYKRDFKEVIYKIIKISCSIKSYINIGFLLFTIL